MPKAISKKTAAPKKNPLRHSVTIDVTFGSDFQQGAALRALDSVLKAWAEFVQSQHKKNIIIISHDEGTPTVN